ncbi:hypothetical protein ABW19_dt0202320 [Dactylella cylindrospora]|nr:hypothetical protein ABW19_dt0202320 [Dactylella cylindrospora]
MSTPQDNVAARPLESPMNPGAADVNQNPPRNAPTGPRAQSTGPRGPNRPNNPYGSRTNSTGPQNPGNGAPRDRSSSRGGRGRGRGGYNNIGDRSSSGGSPTRGGFGGPNGPRSASGGRHYQNGNASSGRSDGSRPNSCGPPRNPNAPRGGRNRSRGNGSQARSQSRPNMRDSNPAQTTVGNQMTTSQPSPHTTYQNTNFNNPDYRSQSRGPHNNNRGGRSGSRPTGDNRAPSGQAAHHPAARNSSQSASRERRPGVQPMPARGGNATTAWSGSAPPHPTVAATPGTEAPKTKPELAPIDTTVGGDTAVGGEIGETSAKRRRRRNRGKKRQRKGDGEEGNGDDADNEAASGSEDPVSASPEAIKFGGDLVTASIVTPGTVITMIPVPGVPGGDPTIDDDRIEEIEDDEPQDSDDGVKDAQGVKTQIPAAMEEFRRKNGRYRLLHTRRELTTAVEMMEIYTVVVHSRAANEVVNTIKSVTDNFKEGIPDCQHLRRLVRPENLPPSLTGLPESLFVDYSTENASPPVRVNPDGSVEKRSRGASRAQRRRRNASYRKGEKPLYVLLCPAVAMTIRDLYKALSSHPLFAGVDLDCEIPFDSQDIPQIVKHTVPQWAPSNMRQANHWTEKYWPTIYRRTNPYGPHFFLVSKWDDRLNQLYPVDMMDFVTHEGDPITMGEYYMALARKVAEEGEKKGAGLRIGCVVVELKDKDCPKYGRVMAVAHDARLQSGNPLAHACYRAISLVGRKRVEVTARHKPKVNMFSVNGPNSEMEEDYYARVPGDPDGYLMNDLVVFMTHEPCVMCSMAMVHSRIGCFVFGEKMVSGGLHADLAPPGGHTLPFKGVTNQDVDEYRKINGVTEADLRKRRTADDIADESLSKIESDLKTSKAQSKANAKKKRAKDKKKDKSGDGNKSEADDENNKQKKGSNSPSKEELLRAAAEELKKEWAPIDPAIRTDEAVIEVCKDKASLHKIRDRDMPKFKALCESLIVEREAYLAELEASNRLAASLESQRKEHKIDDGAQPAKIFDPIKDGVEYLGAASKVKIGAPAPKTNENLEVSRSNLTAENLEELLQTVNVDDASVEQLVGEDAGPSVYGLEDGGKFAQTCSVYNADSNYAKSGAENDPVKVNMMPKLPEEGTTLVKEDGKGGSSDIKIESRDNSPGFFGDLGMIDIVGVNEDSTLVATATIVKDEKGSQDKRKDAADEKPTVEAERGRSRAPAPFKPGTGEFVPVNVSYVSPPSGNSAEEFTTSGGEDTAGTGPEDSDPELNVGAALDVMTMEAPDTAEGNGENKAVGKKRRKKRSKKKKVANADGEAAPTQASDGQATSDQIPTDKTASGQTEGFEVISVGEAKEGTSAGGVEAVSTTHGSSTTIPTVASEVNKDQNTGTTNPATSRPQSPGKDNPTTEEDKKKEDLEPDELVNPDRPRRVLGERYNAGYPKYDHGPGDGYGLFWREKLNWKFLCFQYKPRENEEEWDAQLEYMGLGNDRIHA